MAHNMYACFNPFSCWSGYNLAPDDMQKMQHQVNKAVDGMSTAWQIILQAAQQLNNKSVDFTKKQMQKSVEYGKEVSERPSSLHEKQADFIYNMIADYRSHFQELLEMGMKCNTDLMSIYLEKIMPAAAECSKPVSKPSGQK